MKKTRILSWALAVTLAVTGLVSCGPGNGKDDSSKAESQAASQGEAQDSQDTQEPEDDTEPYVPLEGLERSGEIRDLSPMELVAEMKTGWNLGNSLDANSAEGLAAETSWGNPRITKELIDEVNARGFDVIRIPVTWGGHMGAGPDYTVDPAWMDRVQEVVNYAYDDGMFIILDSHHEEDWRIPDDAHIDAVDEQVRALWVQIAERFKDYGDHLVFDGLNEPRVKDGANEWNGGTEEGRRCLDRLNQTFIDAVRSTGGNKETRLLLVTTFASSSCQAAISDVAIPDDPHIGFSIHSYTPYAFTYNANADWELFTWDGSHDGEIIGVMYDLKETFIDKGVPVIMTEYGAVNKDFNDEEVAKWVTVYLKTAKDVGIPCVWWDNGSYLSGGEQFAVYDRKNMKWYTDTVVDAIMAVFEDSEEPDEPEAPKENPIEALEGMYAKDRITIKLEAEGDSQGHVTLYWGDSAATTYVWEMTGEAEATEDGAVISYIRGENYKLTYTSATEEPEREDISNDGTGKVTITVSDGGKSMTWEDNTHAAEEYVFDYFMTLEYWDAS